MPGTGPSAGHRFRLLQLLGHYLRNPEPFARPGPAYAPPLPFRLVCAVCGAEPPPHATRCPACGESFQLPNSGRG